MVGNEEKQDVDKGFAWVVLAGTGVLSLRARVIGLVLSFWSGFIDKIRHFRELYNPLYPLLYGKTGVYRGIPLFLISFYPKHRGGSNVYTPQSMF